ncbi:MAG: M14 family metallopeptidase [Gemmatimonadota bacterium]|nr:MAG: M14 family metallopeptidase [Gemmatimonadota bacterium]
MLLRHLGLAVVISSMSAEATAAQSLTARLSDIQTRAESTRYVETSSYADVMDFVTRISDASPILHLTTFGYTSEGRALPLVIVGRLDDVRPEAILESGKTRLYVQANIHAGEVCGKEAMQVLLRDLANGDHAAWLDSLVLLIAPIYNADGNERVRLTNRGRQHGPLGGMGQRANAQGLDLNRDHMKIDSPEARSLIAMMNAYDPHVLVDLHTTNGTTHAYHLTYAPPLNPNTAPAIDQLLRGDLLPAVTNAVKRKHGWDFYYYGNLPWRGGGAERGWYTFDHRPRFNNNYIGLRNRIAVLGEAYSYAVFEDRVKASLWLVEEVAHYVHANASQVREVVAQADGAVISGRELGVRFAHARSDEQVEILMGDVVEERNPYSGRTILRRVDVSRPEMMYEYGTFRPTETERVPTTYIVPGELTDVLTKLGDHGVRWTELTTPFSGTVERFVIDSTTVSAREFQGHNERTLYGRYEEAESTIPAGAVMVSLDQPLGRLAFYLLEPRSDDGLVNWNVLDEALEGAEYYPIVRTVGN